MNDDTENELQKRNQLTNDNDFLVLNIDASVGGLQALESIFENINDDSGIVFVLVIQLSPENEIHADALLQNVTGLTITQANDTIHLESNKVYVIPRTKRLSLENGRIYVRDPDSLTTEELEASRKELQSNNEKLTTANQELKNKIEELNQANEDLQNIISSTDIATIFLDRDLRIKYYTPRATDIFSLTSAHIGCPLADITHRLDYEHILSDAGQVLNVLQKIERVIITKDGSYFIARVLPYCTKQDRIYGVVLTFLDFTGYKNNFEAELRIKQEALEHNIKESIVKSEDAKTNLQTEMNERVRLGQERTKILRHLIFAQEDERRRISREMHDQYGQQLTALIFKLGMLKNKYGNQSELGEEIEELEIVVKQLDDDIDFFIWKIRPITLDDFGLKESLANYVENWSKRFNIPSKFHTKGFDNYRLTSEIETTLYRITQEVLNNIAKHAKASNVYTILEHHSGYVSLIIEDDGVGFNIEDVMGKNRKGLGLVGIRERAGLFDGTVEIESVAGNGTTIFVRIPIPDAIRGAIYE